MDPIYKSGCYSAVVLDAVSRDISPTVARLGGDPLHLLVAPCLVDGDAAILGVQQHGDSLVPERIGSLLSINALRQDLDAAFTTVQAWIEILERLYFIF